MTALKFYLTRAVYDWAVDNGLTPHIIVDTGAAGVVVPSGQIENGRIVLNIHPRAVHGFGFDETGIRFSARFGGRSFAVDVPLPALMAIYAKENGQGVSFPERDEPPQEPAGTPRGAKAEPRRKRPVLKRIK